MKKILKCLLALSVYCLSSSFGAEDQKCVDAIDPLVMENSKTPNKVKILLVQERFSDSKDIDYDELEKHIRYSFKNKRLLLDALHPLLLEGLLLDKQEFDRLELLGDSALGFFIKSRLIALLPKTNRHDIGKIYESITCNQTLTDIYLRNLNIEHYLPFPGEKKYCEVCNVVESLIGGICCDDPINGFENSKRFIAYILNDHILKEKIEEYSSSTGKKITIEILPYQEETINKICPLERLSSANPKALLNEILLCLWNDRPNYEVSTEEKDGVVRYLATVLGVQIGNTIQGEGDTKQESKENAARGAINFLASKELLPRNDTIVSDKPYRSRLIEYLGASGKICTFEDVTPPIKAQVIFKDKIIEGIGGSIEEARNSATKEVYHYLKDPIFSHENKALGPKSYRILLSEFFALLKHTDYNISTSSQQGFTHQIKFRSKIIGNGLASSKLEAKEEASKEAFLFLRNEDPENYNFSLPLLLMLWRLDDCKLDHQQIFKFRVKLKDNDEVLGEGKGKSIGEAKEQAARNAYDQLRQKERSESERRENLKEQLRSSASEAASKAKSKGKKRILPSPSKAPHG